MDRGTPLPTVLLQTPVNQQARRRGPAAVRKGDGSWLLGRDADGALSRGDPVSPTRHIRGHTHGCVCSPVGTETARGHQALPVGLRQEVGPDRHSASSETSPRGLLGEPRPGQCPLSAGAGLCHHEDTREPRGDPNNSTAPHAPTVTLANCVSSGNEAARRCPRRALPKSPFTGLCGVWEPDRTLWPARGLPRSTEAGRHSPSKAAGDWEGGQKGAQDVGQAWEQNGKTFRREDRQEVEDKTGGKQETEGQTPGGRPIPNGKDKHELPAVDSLFRVARVTHSSFPRGTERGAPSQEAWLSKLRAGPRVSTAPQVEGQVTASGPSRCETD